MFFIMNLTQYKATPEQHSAGVRDLEGEDFILLKELMTFEELPNKKDISNRASQIALLASNVAAREGIPRTDVSVMIGGPGYWLPELTDALVSVGFVVLQSFTRWEVVVSTT